MMVKLDENVDLRVIPLFNLAGHDTATVQGQGLISAPDTEVIRVCQSEGRCLVTADRGFGNRMRFNPAEYAGIVVIRLPSKPSVRDWREAIAILIQGLETASVEGKLWIVQRGRIIEYVAIESEEI